MIVVDTNIIAYFWLNGEFTEYAKRLFQKDSNWVAPILWRSEFRSILSLYIRKNILEINDAIEIVQKAEKSLKGNEYYINSFDLLEKIKYCSLSAYDLEFIVLAELLNIKLFTLDNKILNEFPKLAVSLKTI